jgi:hypothetical protein
MNEKIKVQCVGRRHLELSRMEDGNLMIVVVWKEAQELAHLVLEPREEAVLKRALRAMSDDFRNAGIIQMMEAGH